MIAFDPKKSESPPPATEDHPVRKRKTAARQRRKLAFPKLPEIPDFANIREELEKCRKNEIELRQAEALLREELNGRDEFLSIASHELKTPIVTLKLQTDLFKLRVQNIETGMIDRGSITQLLDQLNRQMDHLGKLIDEMLDLSRMDHGKLVLHLEPFNLCQLVHEVKNRFSDLLEKKGCSCLLNDQSLINGLWDRDKLEQVVSNLILNAIEYAPGSPIEISISTEMNTTTTNWAVLKVKDGGNGIDPKNIKRIFQRFERGSRASQSGGLGLGLYISRQIIEAHRGIIYAESEPGQGATFIVKLPLTQN